MATTLLTAPLLKAYHVVSSANDVQVSCYTVILELNSPNLWSLFNNVFKDIMYILYYDNDAKEVNRKKHYSEILEHDVLARCVCVF